MIPKATKFVTLHWNNNGFEDESTDLLSVMPTLKIIVEEAWGDEVDIRETSLDNIMPDDEDAFVRVLEALGYEVEEIQSIN